ncbi:MAG TPA: VOC family protein [Solirubrobacteraceae bacterium]|nr:VOC family protein [Solirubrobacteraceae bacterium]
MKPITDRPRRSTTGAALADATRLGAVHLTVTDLDRSVAYYGDAIGLRLHRRDGRVAALGAGAEDVVVLHEDAAARRAGRHAGLYHVALLYPSREELARAAVRLVATRVPIQGASNHGTHEAIYLPDPDGNGLELAADFPREQWPDISGPEGYGGGPAPLDLEGLLDTVAGEAPTRHAAPGLKVGHVHLHVGDLDAATPFYRDGLGFEVMTDLGTAVFLSAGGYHHHVGVNVWRGRGVPPAPADAVGLRHWTLVVDGEDELAAVRERLLASGAPVEPQPDGLLTRDPSGTAVLVVA